MSPVNLAGRSVGMGLVLGALVAVSSCASGETEGTGEEIEKSTGGSVGQGGSSGAAGAKGGSAGSVAGAAGSGGGLTGGSNATGGSASGAGGGNGGMSAGGAAGSAAGTAPGGSSGASGFGGSVGQSGAGAGGVAGAGGGAGSSGSAGSWNGGSSFGSNGVAPPPDINGGSQGWASRYWDCCKPACGWSGNTGGRNPVKSCDRSNNVIGDNNAQNICMQNGPAYMCWDYAPWAVGDELAYGFAAASGGNYSCGRCYHLEFTGTSHNGSPLGVAAIAGKHMIVQVINNGGVGNDQFDLLIPGGGVGQFDGCSSQFNSADIGAREGGVLRACNNDIACAIERCEKVFAGKEALLKGCDWMFTWFGGADNPNLKFERVACPQAITQKSGLSDPG